MFVWQHNMRTCSIHSAWLWFEINRAHDGSQDHSSCRILAGCQGHSSR